MTSQVKSFKKLTVFVFHVWYFMLQITAAYKRDYRMKHKLHQCFKGKLGGQNLSPTDIHKCSTSSNCNTWILYYFFLMWTIHNEYIPCCSHQSIALGSVCLKESSSSDSDVGTSLEGVCRLFGPALPWHTYHSFRLVTWGERFDERFLWGSRFGERASPIVVDEGW